LPYVARTLTIVGAAVGVAVAAAADGLATAPGAPLPPPQPATRAALIANPKTRDT
jgi:hypothetical protein